MEIRRAVESCAIPPPQKNDGLLTAASILPEDTASKLLNTGTRVPGSKSFNSNVVLVKKFIFFTNFCTDIPLGKVLLGNKLSIRHCDLFKGGLIFLILGWRILVCFTFESGAEVVITNPSINPINNPVTKYFIWFSNSYSADLSCAKRTWSNNVG